MTDAGAHSAVVTSAVVVAGIYFFRKLTHQSGAIPAHSGSVPELGRWIIGYGVSFFALAVIATAAPQLGGWLAILLATGTLLVNGLDLSHDLQRKVNRK